VQAVRAIVLVVLTLFGVACGGSHGSPARAPESKPTEVDLAEGSTTPADARVATASGWTRPTLAGATSTQVPVDGGDASWGSPTAPVTLVIFSDFQCPFCSRAHPTVTQLQQTYGPDKLRVVFKHNPLPFHQDAMPAAIAAQAVYELGGPQAFYAYADLLFRGQRALTDANLLQWAADVGVERNAFLRMVGSREVRAKIDADMDLAKTLGLSGTPSFMINGARLVGAQPYEEFKSLVDQELVATRSLKAEGVADGDLYARRVGTNYTAPEERPSFSAPSAAPPDTTVWKVAVGKSPTQGPADALVTIVEFSDYQCPYCKKAHKTVAEVLKRYPGKVRVVYKHQPLSFHKRALPAALFAAEARAQKGDKGFWQATDLLFERAPELEDEHLLEMAKELKLNVPRVKQALANEMHKSRIQADMDLADEVEARGTPAFYINGRKLSGAQPIEKFSALIDEELDKAEALVRAGTRKASVYSETIKNGRLGKPLDIAQATPTFGKSNPSRGPAKAPVVIQIFSDFQCPFCQRVLPSLKEIEKQYPGQIRFVWRNYPLPFHQDARPAAMAAMEAFSQKGDKGFWQMHDLLFANQRSGLGRQELEGHAKTLGLAIDKFRAALDSGAHESAIQADEAAAKAAGVRGTPGFVINGYYVSGAQPASTFKKVIRRALEDRRLGRKAAP